LEHPVPSDKECKAALTFCIALIARSYMKSIFAEAVEQDFLLKDPTRGIKIPRNLREKDKTTLTWHQLRAVLASATTRDRMLLDA
jgi:hypothetical protein